MTTTERTAAIKQLPRWRRPLPKLPRTPEDEQISTDHRAAFEASSLREALYDLVGDAPVMFSELAAGIREHWGEAKHIDIAAQLSGLARSGAIRRSGDGWVRVEPDETEDE